jgi:hypothetical protein
VWGRAGNGTYIIPALSRRLREEDHKMETGLGYILRLFQKQKQKKNN